MLKSDTYCDTTPKRGDSEIMAEKADRMFFYFAMLLLFFVLDAGKDVTIVSSSRSTVFGVHEQQMSSQCGGVYVETTRRFKIIAQSGDLLRN